MTQQLLTNCFLLLTVKADELKKDTLVMKEEFERVVDRKDAIVHSLARDIEEAEEQYPTTLHLITFIHLYMYIPIMCLHTYLHTTYTYIPTYLPIINKHTFLDEHLPIDIKLL